MMSAPELLSDSVQRTVHLYHVQNSTNAPVSAPYNGANGLRRIVNCDSQADIMVSIRSNTTESEGRSWCTVISDLELHETLTNSVNESLIVRFDNIRKLLIHSERKHMDWSIECLMIS